MEKKYIKATDVKDELDIKPGHIIRLYGKETIVEGFHPTYNDALERWETIMLTEGRGDPFERSLDVIEVLQDQPPAEAERVKLTPEQIQERKEAIEWYRNPASHKGEVWVKDALKWAKEAIEFADKELTCPQHYIETWGNMIMNALHAIQEAQNESAGESECALKVGLKFRSKVAPLCSYEVVKIFPKTKEFKVKETRECQVSGTTCYEIWSIEGFEKYYNLGVYYIQKEVKP